MTLRDDLAGDLANVFYEDVSTVAIVAGQNVTGHLSKGDSAFGMDAETYLFDAPAVPLKDVRRGDPITVDGLIYKVVRPDYFGDRITLVLALT